MLFRVLFRLRLDKMKELLDEVVKKLDEEEGEDC